MPAQREKGETLKAPRFAYAKARRLEDVFDALAADPDGTRILAGGQSLVPSLAMRLSEPRLLVDINGLAELGDIEERSGAIRIGALVRHAELGRSPLVAKHLPLLAQAVPHIAHPAIRNRGTFGGSLAFADPAAELPACVVALGADLIAASRRGERRIPAVEFFTGLYETALAPDEVLTGAELPARRPDERSLFLELARRRGDYAIVGVAVHGRFVGDTASELSCVFLGVGATPVIARRAAAAASAGPLAGRIDAAVEALGEDLDPPGDLHGSPATKLHLARVLLKRALGAFIGNAAEAA